MAAAETKNPRRNLPRAIKLIYIRIIVFYICGVFVVGLLVPSNDPKLILGGSDASASPFVIAIERAGIKALPSIINVVLVSAAWSAGTSDLYTSSRALCTLHLIQLLFLSILTKSCRWPCYCRERSTNLH